MNPEAPVEDTIQIGRREIAQGLLAIVAVAAAGFAVSENLGKVEGVEPIRVPADATLKSGPKDPLKIFEVPTKSEAAGVFCGKIAIRLSDDFVPPKYVIPLHDGTGKTFAECNTANAPRHIPVEHYKPAGAHHKPAGKGHKAGGKHHHRPAGKHRKPAHKK